MKITSRKSEILLDRSRNLRKNMTKEEKHLWYDYLNKLDVRFYRQRVIEGYIVDFYCPSLKLVIEIDGGQHYMEEAMDYDEHRSEILGRLGIEVIRYVNRQVRINFESVCWDIENRIEDRVRELGAEESSN